MADVCSSQMAAAAESSLSPSNNKLEESWCSASPVWVDKNGNKSCSEDCLCDVIENKTQSEANEDDESMMMSMVYIHEEDEQLERLVQSEDSGLSSQQQGLEDDEEEEVDIGERRAEEWVLPPGAAPIIRQLAAEQILFELLGDIFGMAIVGQPPSGLLLEPKQKQAEFGAIGALAREFPGTCQRRYNFVWEDAAIRQLTPLAALCCLRPPLDVLQTLYRAYPEAVQVVETTRESLPLHYACGFGASLAVVQFLYHAYPPAIAACRTDKVTPLHLACAYYKGGSEPDVIDFLLTACPTGAQQAATDMKWLPLHSCAHGGAPPCVLERLIDLVPNSLATPDSKGRTPLHIACERKGNLAGVQYLLSKAPAQVLTMEDDSRFTPLSLAAMHQTVPVLQMLLEQHEVLEDPHGVTLLHMAAFQNDVSVIDFLAVRYPYMLTARVRDGDQYTPLLAACRHEAELSVVQALIRHDPMTLQMTDGEGRLPLESARQANAKPDVLQLLQDEMNALAAQAFQHLSWEPPSSSAAASLLARSDDELYSIPSLESSPSFSSEVMVISPPSMRSLRAAGSNSSSNEHNRLARWWRGWRRYCSSLSCLPPKASSTARSRRRSNSDNRRTFKWRRTLSTSSSSSVQ